MNPVTGPLSAKDPLRIGLISDTHIPESRYELWPQVFEAFAGVDAILHAGDIHDLVVIDQLHDRITAPVRLAWERPDLGPGHVRDSTRAPSRSRH